MKQSIWFQSCAVFISCLMLWNSAYAAMLVYAQEDWNSMRGLIKNPYPGRQYTKSRVKEKKHPAHKSYDRETRGGLWSAKALQAYRVNKAIRDSNRGLWTVDTMLALPQGESNSGSEFPWEGTHDGVNTATGNKLISLPLIE